jgi:cholesterol transport system auxiliary component
MMGRIATSRFVLAMTAALPLAGCISFAAKPPPTLFTLSAATPPAAGERSATVGDTITVAVPTIPQALQTMRLPVHTTPTSYAYLKNAQWVEPPNRLFGRLLDDVISQRTGKVVLSSQQTQFDPGLKLTGELAAFDLDLTQGRVAHVRYDAAIVARDGGRIETRRFEANRPVASEDPVTVSVALNAAANDVAAQVADWVGRR